MKWWGYRYFSLVLGLLFTAYFLLVPALAHVPTFGGDGKSLETAILVEEPAKSRVLYGQLLAGENRYYSFEMEKGERILLGLTIPVEDGARGFLPELILMGPGLENEGKVPENLEIPQGYGVKVFSEKLPETPTYEGFSPSAFYSPIRADLNAPENGTYYVVVSSAKAAGNYGIVVGYEETFTLEEWLTVPLNQIRIYQWEGQSLPLIFAPVGITLLIGLFLIYFKRKDSMDFKPGRIFGILAGLLFLGTGASFIFQMLLSLSKSSYSSEAIITLILGFASIVLGIIALGLSLKKGNSNTDSLRRRLYFFGLGIAGLFLWAGWIIGPLLAFGAGLLPWKQKE